MLKHCTRHIIILHRIIITNMLIPKLLINNRNTIKYNKYLIVSNMVTSDRSVVTSSTILPGTTSGITTKLPQDMTTNRVLGK